jgi:hypothetical protein
VWRLPEVRSNRTDQLPIVLALSSAVHWTWWMLAGDKHYFYALSLRQGERTLASTFPHGFLGEGSTFNVQPLCRICAVRRAAVEVSFPLYFSRKTYSNPPFLSLLPLVAALNPFYRVTHHRHSDREAFSHRYSPTPSFPSNFLACHEVNDSSFD